MITAGVEELPINRHDLQLDMNNHGKMMLILSASPM